MTLERLSLFLSQMEGALSVCPSHSASGCRRRHDGPPFLDSQVLSYPGLPMVEIEWKGTLHGYC